MNSENQLRAELARLRNEMAALLAVNETMRVSRDLGTLYHVVATQLGTVIDFDSLFIGLYLPESDSIHYVYSIDEGVVDPNNADVRAVANSPLSGRIIRERVAVQIDDLTQIDRNVHSTMGAFGNTEKRSRAWMAVPMASGDTIQGVLSIQSYRPAAFSQADATLLQLLASQIGVAIENARLIDQLKHTIAELSTPIIPVAAGVLVLPLVGRIDAERSERLLEQVLGAVVARQADRLIIDVTGVVATDGRVVAQLMKIIQAAGLLGAQTSVVGISAALARTALQLGLDLAALHTYRDLHSALAELL